MPTTRGYAALAAGVIAISWSAIFIRWAPMPGPASAFYRLLFASLIFCPWVAVRHRESRFGWSSLLLAGVGGVFFAADLALYSIAVLNGSAANATVLANNTPIWVVFLVWIISRKGPPRSFWVGLAIALAGSVLIVGEDLRRHADFGAADLLALASSACFAIYLFVTERLRVKLGTAVLTALSMAASTLALFVFDFATGVSLNVPGPRAWLALAGLALVCQLAGYFALTYALGYVSAEISSVTLLVQCPLTALLAWWLLNEPIGFAQIAGGALVLAGVWMVNRFARRSGGANQDGGDVIGAAGLASGLD